MVADAYPKRLRIEAIATGRPRRRRELNILLHRDGLFYLDECAWNFISSPHYDTAVAASFRIEAAATRAHGGNRVHLAGLMFDDPSPAPRLRVEVTGGVDSPRGVEAWMTAVLFEGGVEVDATVPAPAPLASGLERSADGTLRRARFREAAREAARQLLRDRHDFLAGRPVP